jgi:hypothetical protein
MNFPVGTVIASAPLPIDIVAVSDELKKINFNGYIIMSVNGNSFEEGVLFFKDGTFFAGITECAIIEKIFKGDDALKYIMNQTKGVGFFQTIQLSKSQVDLITAFDEKLLFSNKLDLKDLPKLIPNNFNENFVPEEQKSDVFGKYGLGSLIK